MRALTDGTSLETGVVHEGFLSELALGPAGKSTQARNRKDQGLGRAVEGVRFRMEQKD